MSNCKSGSSRRLHTTTTSSVSTSNRSYLLFPTSLRENQARKFLSQEDFRKDAHCALRVTRFTVRYFRRVSDAKSYLTVVLQSESRYRGVRCVYYLLASPIYFPRRNFSASDCEPFYSIGSSSHFWPHTLDS